ncbi:MAG: DNA mismatch repair endonuclease MutL [Treponema sp.]|nr:DNA mismatch repair endonuclease MutL [Treponema sp.]
MSAEGARIQVLPPDEARKIAAGEVVDRPAALVREFIDNALDAGAGRVRLFVDGGGTRRIEAADDGCGMGPEDLALCPLAHATSKIRCLDDLNTARSLGFRGEALAAAAAVSRLEIETSTDGVEAWKLRAGPGGRFPPAIERTNRARGTSVRALGLFDTLPARKKFLKRDGAEGALCRTVFNEKALAFPNVTFHLTLEGHDAALFAPATLAGRFAAVTLSPHEAPFLHEIHGLGEGFAVTILAGGPELYRQDRRLQFVFANTRRLNDWSLLQALEYGLEGWFPNGSHPIGAIYIDIDPRLADFNIHPAKREARFADQGALHHAITSALRSYTRKSFSGAPYAERGDERGGRGSAPLSPGAALAADAAAGVEGGAAGGGAHGAGGAGIDSAARRAALAALLERPPAFAPKPGRGAKGGDALSVAEQEPAYETGAPRLLGRAFGLFIIVEKGDTLFLIDQHAAHERILYDAFLAGDIPRQELLVPIAFTTESPEDDRFLAAEQAALGALGISLTREGEGWVIDALPAGWREGDGDTVRELLNLKSAGAQMAEHWAAACACRAAVKDGTALDDTTAFALAEAALALPVPRCPHGRPIWFRITRDEACKAVRRSKG